MNRDSEHLACCFDAYCKRLLKNEVIDTIRGEKRMGQREVTFSDLTKAEKGQLQYIDQYAPDRRVFPLEMPRKLEQGKADLVITKDLSRLGRDMREASYYAEQFFPEHGIQYIAIADNFDTEHDNIMAPFLFAMNEVYLRDGSRKVKDVLRSKRESGQYCTCPPYGYRKDPKNRHRLAPDEMTAPVVERIFKRAVEGDSARKIALDLNADGIIPPLKYRVLYRDEFSDEGAARASDLWNYTTVNRITGETTPAPAMVHPGGQCASIRFFTERFANLPA